ncbi:HlyC/CorC family transporter [Niallia circulans]|uniref:Membrane protein n=1 Tax=Niallia circulans TaxID=1397 RepID=A0A0J1KHS7_NIACI|nr:hemolysin family protein [Niallia circulans]KLV16070.1 membrane protein [Niallia circulans]MCM2982782.1 hemolysin family protein [Niallia circulans]MDR4315947.1 HlyC/CorC family transporter [Niallia circulans]MED3841239.1 hemolysin family protein [Niallia circulans]MED4244791.1 hemolysin family protein [Niallia circulans]
MDIFNLVIIAILIALTAFFVASEFAIIRVRSSRINQLIEEGHKNALSAKKVTSNLDEYLSACQLGITVTALGIGWIGEETVQHVLAPLLQIIHVPDTAITVLSFSLAFAFITFLHVVVGELAPKTFAIHKAEQITLWAAKPLILFYKLLYPFIWTLNGSSRIITRMFGIKAASEHELAHTEEELRIIVSESYKNGEINQSEFKYVNNIFDFDDRIAKEIMVPRTEIASLEQSSTLEELLNLIQKEQFTRYPITDGDKDHIIGMINVKEIMTELLKSRDLTTKTLKPYIRPVIRVIETYPIQDLLLKMQKDRIHMAILMDEYGGTSGLVTVEDIIEEIVGDIWDEFDQEEVPTVRTIKENHYILDAKVLINEVNALLQIDINDEVIDTLGGWILTSNYEASEGDTVMFKSYAFKIVEMEDHHIKYVEVKKLSDVPVQQTKHITVQQSIPSPSSEAEIVS